ncbi:MAG TPA: metallophosphoesterase [Terriglobales bacterium]|nr:metallophosphoesterase [Terriglobales bacterium]
MRSRIAVFVVIIQSVLFLTHWFLYETWTAFWGAPAASGLSRLQVALALLSVSFVVASLLAWRSSHLVVRVLYRISAVWLGTLSFCFLAACACWAVYGGARLAGLHPDGRVLVSVFLGLALLASLFGVVNAAWTRVRRVVVKLPNLPESWRGRVAALVSDIHLGHVRGARFLRRIVTTLTRLQPDIVFIAGDMYDGTVAKVNELAAPLARLAAPWGAYFVAGNHEEFSDSAKYFDAVKQSGVRVLHNEKVTVDGLQIVGVHYRDSTNDDRFRAALRGAGVDRTSASILLTHAPDRVSITEEEGFSLQLSGHTHGGQFFPFTWITSRLYGKFVYGLQRLGNLLVYTSYGAGTWGPPLRLGTSPEIVLLQFE